MKAKKNHTTPNFRVGIGYDIHRLDKNRKLILGGIQIPSQKGLLGHSDADVLLHAICDALLGAVSLGDIGKHFPNTDKKYKDISSIELLKHVSKLLTQKGYEIGNIDSTVILESPKIGKFIDKMRRKISEAINVSLDQISIKATTNEELGALGREEGCAAIAIVTIIANHRV
jgi:2-C-methyl-D-erythritol 2,4-cyclodiphosphate synthase